MHALERADEAIRVFLGIDGLVQARHDVLEQHVVDLAHQRVALLDCWFPAEWDVVDVRGAR